MISCHLCGQAVRVPKKCANGDVCKACYTNPTRDLDPTEPVFDMSWKAYRLACADVGYALPQAPSRAARDWLHDRWTWHLYVGAVVNKTLVPDVCIGPRWDAAKEVAIHLSPPQQALYRGFKV